MITSQSEFKNHIQGCLLYKGINNIGDYLRVRHSAALE